MEVSAERVKRADGSQWQSCELFVKFGGRMSATMTDEDRRVLELQKRREANIRKKEQQRIEAEALEEQKQKHFLELERQRQAVIAQKEEEWSLKEEAQRKKDEATILYIREARERRRQEKEAEKLELEQELKRQQKLEQV